MSVRTIFLMIRGSYQAGMATRMARQDLKKLSNAQREIVRRTEDMMRAANQWIFAGAAFTTFGTMMTKSLMKIMELSGTGQRALMNFSRRTQQSMQRLSEAFSPIMGDILNIVAGFMELITINPVLRAIAVGVMLIVGPLLTLSGVALLASGGVKVLSAGLAVLSKRSLTAAAGTKVLTPTMLNFTSGTYIASIGTKTLTASMTGLAIAAGRALAVFTIVYSVMSFLQSKFGTINAALITLTGTVIILGIALWKTAAAMSVLTWGAAAIAGIGAVALAQQSMQSYHSGTAFVRKGGMAMLSGGEEIISARESRTTSLIERETHREIERGPMRSSTTITIPINQVNTRANVDDVQEVIGRAIKDAVDNKV